jgi:rhamnosyltransferase
MRLFDSLACQTIRFDLFVVDSCSADGTLELTMERVDRVISIPRADFNHGLTRQMMVQMNPGYDVYVFLTQDACLDHPQAIERLIAPFADEHVGAVCGRQLPHLGSGPLEMHARVFNYPEESNVRSINDDIVPGLKTVFMSNSFAAYRATALQQVGGFPEHVILCEDMYVAAKMFLTGWKIAYAADALCRHSHNYTIGQEFMRYFDIGVFHARESWISNNFGGAGREGLHYVQSELRYLGLGNLHLLPVSLFRNALKLIGYKTGLQEKHIPLWLKRNIGMHRSYWEGPYAQENNRQAFAVKKHGFV